MRYKPGIAGELIIPRQKEPLRMKPMQTMQSLERDATWWHNLSPWIQPCLKFVILLHKPIYSSLCLSHFEPDFSYLPSRVLINTFLQHITCSCYFKCIRYLVSAWKVKPLALGVSHIVLLECVFLSFKKIHLKFSFK